MSSPKKIPKTKPKGTKKKHPWGKWNPNWLQEKGTPVPATNKDQ